jgi:signal transduction histidine kinase
MPPLWPSGLRGRLLIAFVVTSIMTLGVATGVVLGPLRDRLRQQSVENLVIPVRDAGPGFALQVRKPAVDQVGLDRMAFDLSDRVDARVFVSNASWTSRNLATDELEFNTFLADTTFGPTSPEATLAALRAMRLATEVTLFNGDDVTIGEPLTDASGRIIGALVAERRLTEVTTAVDQVRTALLAAALIGLAVAIALAVTFSRTLTRRLGRLRRAALRVTEEGFDVPMPRDTGRDEVGDLARALGRMQEELHRQESARRSFVATASHELRTPLTMLQGTMELLEEDLRDGGDLDDAQTQVANARRELLRLSALASELLDLSRLDAAVQLRSEPVELGEVARAVAAEFELRARERGVDIEMVPQPAACWGRGDPDAVARVVRILLDNGLRYAPAGEPLRVLTSCDERAATVEVADRGPGIPEEEREQIFERFHRGRAAGSASGFGLGLAIGRELAERMGGTLRLEQHEPAEHGADARARGARFVLTLPPAPGAVTPAPGRAVRAAS